jgi:RNase P subunit RPR2
MMTGKQTYCTRCKTNVDIIDGKYVRLANNRAVFEGQCSQCGTKLIKARVMPRSSAVMVRRKRKGLLR